MAENYKRPPAAKYTPSSSQGLIRSGSSVLALTSPTKLNVVSSDWKAGVQKPQVSSSGSQNHLSQQLNSHSQPSLQFNEVVDIDRYIPARLDKTSSKLEAHSVLPPPNASPSSHMRAQSKIIFQNTVASACGVKMGQRILQYQPEPPRASSRHTYEYKPRVMKLRKISSNPERILDAPGFQDDFYLNLISWSPKSYLAIALESSMYIWNSLNGSVSLLTETGDSLITSVVWSDDGCYLSIGKDDGNVEIWDMDSCTRVRTMRTALGVRIGSQSWCRNLVSVGAKSGDILLNDVRVKDHIVGRLSHHQGEVCGLSYRRDGQQLASGGNDNTVCIWDSRQSMPQFVKNNHTAAVKALSWNPEVNSLLATGGGSTDRHIHFWNTSSGARINSIDTGSQISSLHWGLGNNSTEILATGGYPNNSISIYSYEERYKLAEIEHAHDSRIISSALSPDGVTLATVGADENLKFFKVFEPVKKTTEDAPVIGSGKDISNIMTIR